MQPLGRSMGRWEVRSALLLLLASSGVLLLLLCAIVCLPSGPPSALSVHHSAITSAHSAIHWLSLVLIVLYIVLILCYAARSPLGRTSTIPHSALPSAISLLSLALTFIRKLIRNDVTGVGGF